MITREAHSSALYFFRIPEIEIAIHRLKVVSI